MKYKTTKYLNWNEIGKGILNIRFNNKIPYNIRCTKETIVVHGRGTGYNGFYIYGKRLPVYISKQLSKYLVFKEECFDHDKYLIDFEGTK